MYVRRAVGNGGGGGITVLPNGVKMAVWDLIKYFKNEKNGFNTKFAFILNGFGQKMGKPVTKQSF
jgi:hypothetical protein